MSELEWFDYVIARVALFVLALMVGLWFGG